MNIALLWYDKLVLLGIAVAFVGFLMFIVGLWFVMDVREEARQALRTSLQDARSALNSKPNGQK